MNIKAVIDTNVLVSAFWTKNREAPGEDNLDFNEKDFRKEDASLHLKRK